MNGRKEQIWNQFSFPRTEGERQNLVILGDACGKLLVQQGGPRIDFF